MEKSRKYFFKPVEEHNAKLRKLDDTLAKVLTRASHKTSPFSTLTNVGIGLWKDNFENNKEENPSLYTITKFNQAYLLRLFEILLWEPVIMENNSYHFADNLVLLEDKFYWTVLVDKPEVRKKVYKTLDSLVKVKASEMLQYLYNKMKDKVFTFEEYIQCMKEFGCEEEKGKNIFMKLFRQQFIESHTQLEQQGDSIIEECINTVEGFLAINKNEEGSGLIEGSADQERIHSVVRNLQLIKAQLSDFDNQDYQKQYESFLVIDKLFRDICSVCHLTNIDSKQVALCV